LIEERKYSSLFILNKLYKQFIGIIFCKHIIPLTTFLVTPTMKKKWASGCRSSLDSIIFEINDIISLYKKNDSERRQPVSLGYWSMILPSIFDDIIVNKVIYI